MGGDKKGRAEARIERGMELGGREEEGPTERCACPLCKVLNPPLSH